MPVHAPDAEVGWFLTPWEDSRREAVVRALRFSIRERLVAIDGLAEVSERLANMPSRRNKGNS